MKSRRQVLRSLGVLGAAGIAGCGTPPDPPSSNEETETSTKTTTKPTSESAFSSLTSISPDYAPKAIPSNSHCFEKDVSRHPIFVDFGEIQYGDAGGWRMRASGVEFTLGESFTIGLQNVSGETIEASSKWRFNLQLYTENGWQEIRWVTGEVSYSESETSIPNGSGYLWQFYSSTDGLLANHPFREELLVCPEVQPGRYRLIFEEQSIAVQFEILG